MSGMDRLLVDAESKCIEFGSRGEAFNDGRLIDITVAANDMGITGPVALSRQVWDLVINPKSELNDDKEIDCDARLQDLLSMVRLATAPVNEGKLGKVTFEIFIELGPTNSHFLDLIAIHEQGDEGEPVLTVKLAEEDEGEEGQEMKRPISDQKDRRR